MDNEQVPEPEDVRTPFVRSIVESNSPKKLIVAGPGTGKTYTFGKVLEDVEGDGLVLTFIRNLVADLAADLSRLARVNTFHAFCKSLLHRVAVTGISNDFDYYPPLDLIICSDLSIAYDVDVDDETLNRMWHGMDDADGVLSMAREVGNYYDTTTHTDLVYRAVLHLQDNPQDVPEYPVVVVDEYQDFSQVETEFIALLARESPVLIAGDDDQALYSFKNASPRYIRDLAADGSYENFELPYCSRCTDVIVCAVNQVIERAQSEGHLADRLHKPFRCHLDSKGEDSEAYPRIIHAHCTVERSNARYTGRYIAREIRAIPSQDFDEARAKGFPCVLVIGPNPFLGSAHKVLDDRFPSVALRKSEFLEVHYLDAYERLSRDDHSRLGWRILLYIETPDGYREAIERALTDGDELSDVIDAEYRDRHLRVAEIVAKVRAGSSLSAAEQRVLEEHSPWTADELVEEFTEDADADAGEEEDQDQTADDYANIVCTSLVGAKGLSAQHVFIVGANNGHFPRDPDSVSDDDVCNLIVALSRTRKQCHVISCRRLGAQRLHRSVFLPWLADLTEDRYVNVEYLNS